MPIIAVLLQVMPGLIASVAALAKAVQADPATPEATKAEYAILFATLDATANAIAASAARQV